MFVDENGARRADHPDGRGLTWSYGVGPPRAVNANPQGPIESIEVRYATFGSDISSLRVNISHNGVGATLRRGSRSLDSLVS